MKKTHSTRTTGLPLLAIELFDVVDTFYESDQGGGQFVSFLKMLAESRPNAEIQEDFITCEEAKKQFCLKVDLP